MAIAPTKTIWAASGTGVGVLLMDLILENDIVAAVVKGILAALIAAVLITVFERRSEADRQARQRAELEIASG